MKYIVYEWKCVCGGELVLVLVVMLVVVVVLTLFTDTWVTSADGSHAHTPPGRLAQDPALPVVPAGMGEVLGEGCGSARPSPPR